MYRINPGAVLHIITAASIGIVPDPHIGSTRPETLGFHSEDKILIKLSVIHKVK